METGLALAALATLMGVAILAYWAFRGPSATGLPVPYARTHVAAELMASFVLLVGAVAELDGAKFGPDLEIAGFAMLSYATLNVIGKFVGDRDRGMVVLLAVQWSVAVSCILVLIFA